MLQKAVLEEHGLEQFTVLMPKNAPKPVTETLSGGQPRIPGGQAAYLVGEGQNFPGTCKYLVYATTVSIVSSQALVPSLI